MWSPFVGFFVAFFLLEERKVTTYKTFTVSFLGKQNLKSGQEKRMCKFSTYGWELLRKPTSWKVLMWDYENYTEEAEILQNQLKIEYSKYRQKFSSHVQNGSTQKLWFKAGRKVTYLTCTSVYLAGSHFTQVLIYSNRDIWYSVRKMDKQMKNSPEEMILQCELFRLTTRPCGRLAV